MFKVGDHVFVTYLKLPGTIVSVNPMHSNGYTYLMIKLDNYENAIIEVADTDLELIGEPKILYTKHGWISYPRST